MEDRSLDEFVDAADPKSGDDTPSDRPDPDRSDDTPDEPAGDPDPDEPPVAPDEVEPARTTYAVGEGACAACDRVVERRWGDEAGLVCPECKEW